MKRGSNPGKKSINQARLQLFKDLDPLGVLVFSAFLFAFLMTLLYSSYLYVKIPLTILLLIALISIEFEHHKPFIDVKILSMNMLLNTTFLRQIGITFIMYLFLYGLPQWMEQSRQISPHNVGLIMLPFSLTAMALSLLVAKNKNNKLLMTTGVLCVIVSTIGIFMLHTASPVYFIVGITIVIGAALGILTVSNQATLYAEVPDDQVGVCFGLFRTVGYIGAMLAGSSLKHQFKSGATDAGLHQLALFSLVACVLIVALLLPLFLKRRKIEIDLEITI
jgi:sugar phosphate permease